MSDEQAKGRARLRNDLLFVSVLAAVILLSILGLLLFRTQGNTVTVSVDGVTVGTYALSKDQAVDIPGYDGGVNRLVIRDGQAWMESASCPDGICVSHRPISYNGQSIICLPNKVVVTIHTQADDASHQPDIAV